MFKVDKEFAQTNVPRTIRFTEKMFDELNRISKKEGVSFNHLVLQCCRYALNDYSSEEELHNF